jgi:hypothetical protein
MRLVSFMLCLACVSCGVDTPTIGHHYTCSAIVSCDGTQIQAPPLNGCADDVWDIETPYRDMTLEFARERCTHYSFPTWCETSLDQVCLL